MLPYLRSISARLTSHNLFRHSTRLALSLALGISAAACTAERPAAPFDVGNMAYPEPLPQGEISARAVSGRTFDTGNMAFPTPLPQGDIAVTRVQ